VLPVIFAEGSVDAPGAALSEHPTDNVIIVAAHKMPANIFLTIMNSFAYINYPLFYHNGKEKSIAFS
jgi:hypothetical protein